MSNYSVERSSAVSHNYRRTGRKIAFTFVFPIRNSKQLLETASGRQNNTNIHRRVPSQVNGLSSNHRRTSSKSIINEEGRKVFKQMLPSTPCGSAYTSEFVLSKDIIQSECQ
jgi:hypothetical protein